LIEYELITPLGVSGATSPRQGGTVLLDDRSPVPLHAQLLASLRARLRAGEWRPGDLLPTDAAFCRAYGVSQITVARALTELAREGAVRRQRGRGTTVLDPTEDSRPTALAFLTPNLAVEWPQRIYGAYEQAAQAAGSYALLTGLPADALGEGALRRRVRTLLAGHVRALALCFVRPEPHDWPFWEGLRDEGVPIAFVGTYEPGLPADRAVADNLGAGALATRHLLGLGHRRVAFLGPTPSLLDNTAVGDRLRGWDQALRETGLDPGALGTATSWALPDALPPGIPDEARRERLLGFLEHTRATAAVTATDELAVFVERHLRPAGVRVPDDVALVGIGDERIAKLADIPVTTARFDPAALGEAAAGLLLRRLAGDDAPPRAATVPVRLAVRASCGATPDGPDDATADLLREAEAALRPAVV
jgi:DNA-binding LacI/PurR family transcriptional regulator